MIVHITCAEKAGIWTASVNGLNGVVAMDLVAPDAVKRCKILALHCLAELMMNDKIEVPWSISFAVDSIVLPKEEPKEESKTQESNA